MSVLLCKQKKICQNTWMTKAQEAYSEVISNIDGFTDEIVVQCDF